MMGLNKNKRDLRIDILRFIAIIGIIIAHSNPPTWLFELRNFDVTLIMMMMGASFYISNKNKEKIDYFPYVVKRFKRLITPTWMFLTLFFILFYMVSLILNDTYYFDLREIIISYGTLGGIGFVWIMRVFFIVALVSPLIFKVSKIIKSSGTYLLLVVMLYILYEICIFIGIKLLEGPFYTLYDQVFLYGFGYAIIAAIGIRLLSMSKKDLILLGGVSFLAFLIFAVFMDFPSTQEFKYTPTLYYLAYGVFVSVILYLLVGIPIINKWLSNKFFMYISINSLWLYFWHIIPIYILKLYGEGTILMSSFLYEFCFVFGVGLLLTYIHEKINDLIKTKKHKKFSLRNKSA